MKVCGHREDAEDTMQDVLLKSLPYLRKIESPQALAVWLYKVTRNRCWMSRRKSRFAPQQMLSLDELMPEPAELEFLQHAAKHSPEAQAISKQSAERLHEAVLRIPAKYRLILVLHDMEELSAAEVARITGLQEGTVRVRLHRARLFVRRELTALAMGKARPAKPSERRPIRRSLDCKHIFAGLSDYLDGTLDEAACAKFQSHIQDCAPCVAFLEDLSRAVARCRASEAGCESTTARALHKVLLQEYQRLSACGVAGCKPQAAVS
jgi:RNA polymerase sigma-70 factor (ECF subfamily)